MENTKNVIDVITDEYDNLFPTEKKIATYIKNNPREVIMLNVSELAKRSGASEATVVRMCKHLGYQGYYQMRLILSRDVGRKEIQNPNNSDEDLLNWVFEQHIHNLHSLISNVFLRPFFLGLKASGPAILKSLTHFTINDGLLIPCDSANS